MASKLSWIAFAPFTLAAFAVKVVQLLFLDESGTFMGILTYSCHISHLRVFWLSSCWVLFSVFVIKKQHRFMCLTKTSLPAFLVC